MAILFLSSKLSVIRKMLDFSFCSWNVLMFLNYLYFELVVVTFSEFLMGFDGFWKMFRIIYSFILLWNFVMVQVNRPPRHGKLEVNLLPRNVDNSFTYLDILSERVLYIHDGSERPADQLDLTMQIPTTMGNLSRNFVMIVSVSPENDAPKIVFPNGPQIEIVPGTARTLTADIMRALDPDSRSSVLNFTLLAPLKVRTQYKKNYFRNASISHISWPCRWQCRSQRRSKKKVYKNVVKYKKIVHYLFTKWLGTRSSMELSRLTDLCFTDCFMHSGSCHEVCVGS